MEPDGGSRDGGPQAELDAGSDGSVGPLDAATDAEAPDATPESDAGKPDAGMPADAAEPDGGGQNDAGVHAPHVVATSPAYGATGISSDATITVTFSESMAPATITAASFFVTQGDSGPVAGTLVTNGSQVTFTPAHPLALGSFYQVTVTSAVSSLAGRPLAEDYSWNFSTKPPAVLRHLRVNNNPNAGSYNAYGKVTDGSGTIACGSFSTRCEADYADGTQVTLTATPVPGFEFVGWTGDDCYQFGTENPVILVMDGPKSCSPNWKSPVGLTFTMTVTYGPWIARVIDDTGYLFNSDPRKIDCGSTPQTTERCQAEFPPGIRTSFKAFPDSNAPAGTLHWMCTSQNPDSAGYEYFTGNSIDLTFYRDLSCNVTLDPLP